MYNKVLFELGKSSLKKKIQEKDVETIVSYPEPIKSKFPFKQQQLLPFDIKDNKLMNSSIFPKTNEEKLENLLQKYSADYKVRVKYSFNKA